MKHNLIATALFLVACGGKPAPEPQAPPALPVAELAPTPVVAAPPAPVTPKPRYGEWGFDRAGMDLTATPGNDFNRYANGTWLKTTPIPADKAQYGMFSVLSDQSDEHTKEIILGAHGAPGTEGQKIGDLYQSFMDEAAIEAKGVAPLQPALDKIAAIKDAKGLTLAFADAARMFHTSPLFTYVSQDDKNPELYIASITQGGLGLPDRDMYDLKNKQFAELRAGYKKYISTMLGYVNTPNVEKRTAAIYALEEKIAAVHWTAVQNRDPVKTYNKLTLAELARLAPGFDWKPWMSAVGLDGQPAVNVKQPSAIEGIAKLVKATPLAVWKDYLTFHRIDDAAQYLPKKFVDTWFELYGKTLSGTPQIKERWKRGVDEVTGSLGEAVGKIYVGKHFSPQAKARAEALVKNLLVAMGTRLDGLTWMSADTKAKAKIKLGTYNPKIGYPKQWRDYSALEVIAGEPLGNGERAAAFGYNRLLAKLGKPVDRDEWGMTPMTINAYYNPLLNEIVFPAAILQPPFFDPNADDAVNYGGIGAVIGHEISHGFDDQGAQYDEKGALKNWWTKIDSDKFKAATAMLVAQYSAYCPFPAADGKPAQCVKGGLTLGENIADLAGLTVAYAAYKLALGGKPAPTLDGFTGDQRFFLGWAQVWRSNIRDAELQSELITNPHSPDSLRVSTVRNLDPWYGAFQPKAGDALFLAPDSRVRLW